MKIGDILRKKTARISTIRMNETVGIAAQLMRASNVSADRKSTRLNSSHSRRSRMPSSA